MIYTGKKVYDPLTESKVIIMISKCESEKRYEKRIQFIMHDINCNREAAERIYRDMEDKTYVIKNSR